MFKSIGYFFLSSGLIGGGALSFFALKAYQNRRRLEKEKSDEEVRDTTRPQYDFFGINWGAKADMMVAEGLNQIQDQLGTGDILFFKEDCSECLSLTSKPNIIR